MELILVIGYALSNMLLLLFYVRKYGWRWSPGIVVLGFYVLIAIIGIPAYDMMKKDDFFYQYNFTNITLFPYIYLFITTLFFLIPTFKFQGIVNRLVRIHLISKKICIQFWSVTGIRQTKPHRIILYKSV